MKSIILRLIIFIGMLCSSANAQLYFPPNNSDTWESMDPSELSWCQDEIDSLYNFLEASNTKAFILLKDGKIVLEQYFNGHTATDTWYWASAGKTVTAFMVGMAQQESFIDITQKTSAYLGQGWTDCTTAQEDSITVWHQLTMTSGMDDAFSADCTVDSCLQYVADAGSRWAYHNAPYTLLTEVIESATGQTMNAYTTQKLLTPTGMEGLYVPVDFNRVFFSTPRSMARYGLLILNEGNWNGTQILNDANYFQNMVNTSQSINEAYGYLWWLNGSSTFMLPQTQFVFPGKMIPNGPDDLFMGVGKNGQYVSVIPSENMVWIRMGDSPSNSLVPQQLGIDITEYLNKLECTSVGVQDQNYLDIQVSPNPAKDILNIQTVNSLPISYQLFDLNGAELLDGKKETKLDIGHLKSGIYLLKVTDGVQSKIIKVVKE